ncbi:hypothetical protein JG677_05550 [Campylobacter sp. TTU-622]|uniref:hypothetical protein n=1 Tax=Campylobacter sp. TTU-622 TaxID=2800583 RepID=UPI001904F4F1|nr:hypothetical protein [Campylobacter sp. TTU-622]MBK1973515.1 hypothetical protein [Campylobacter sp. TTU-622]
MDKAQLIIYLQSLSFIVAGLIFCCILYLFKNKINKITPNNIDNINSDIKDFIKDIAIAPDPNAAYIGQKIKANTDYLVEELKKIKSNH